jgi:excinuclease ABC subunit A
LKESVTSLKVGEGKKQIEIKGARVHNLKNIDVSLPRDKFIVITGLSGSGKSSLAFDTIYAEGQRRYVESLSSYARQFLGRMQKPEVDFIKGIPPAIAIEQKVNTRNPRSTVGTSTEIYDYLKLLYARIGKTFSPISGKEVTKDSVSSIIDFIKTYEEGTKYLILSPAAVNKEIGFKEKLRADLNEGFTRIEAHGKIHKIEEVIDNDQLLAEPDHIHLVIDRMMVKKDEDSLTRAGDSVNQALKEGNGYCSLLFMLNERNERYGFSERYDADGMEFEEPTVHMFSFNNPLGACPRCEGYGKVIGIDEDLVVPDKSLSVFQDAIVCWRGDKMQEWKNQVIMSADHAGFPVHKPYFQLTDDQKRMLWQGTRHFRGIDDFFHHLEEKKYKIQYRVMLSRYRGKTTCPECRGRRLKKQAGYVQINNRSIMDLVVEPISELHNYFNQLPLSEHEMEVSKRIMVEIKNRLSYMVDVGLGYLTLNRLSSTLSGGESQRINLATSLGSSLVGSLYILDEPSIGLHPRDTHRLIRVLDNLKKLGNTLIVVEHDEEIIRAADMLVDIGPEAGRLGGEIMFQGNHEELVQFPHSLTAKYLNEKLFIEVPARRRKWNNYIEIKGARENNLKNISVKLPLNILTVITGVSGSGKSTLVKSILFPALNKLINGYGERTGEHDTVQGDIKILDNVEFVDQNPIGKSSRSNPVTYLKAYDEIRKLFAQQQAATINNLKPSHFSFNIDGGRCEECQGEGEIKVEMQFMADVHLVCESCGGKRFKDDVLEVQYHGRNIHDILEMTVSEAIDFFGRYKKATLERKVVEKLSPLDEVGLGYVKLGQSSSTLSGGESQRVKLASFLGKDIRSQHQLFIFDEPTTGLHFHDIKKLLAAFSALIEKGNSIIIIEHNLEIIKCADWIIDLGPEGGEEGGHLVFEGLPEDIINEKTSHTGRFLKEKL